MRLTVAHNCVVSSCNTVLAFSVDIVKVVETVNAFLNLDDPSGDREFIVPFD